MLPNFLTFFVDNLLLFWALLLKFYFLFYLLVNNTFELGEFFHLINYIFSEPCILSGYIAEQFVFWWVTEAGLVHVKVDADFTCRVYKV